MEENLLSLVSGLSKIILESSDCSKEEKSNSAILHAVRKKGLEVIHHWRDDKKSENEIWYPEILLTDCGYELLNVGASQASESFFKNLERITFKSKTRYYDNLDDIWRLLLALKKPYKAVKGAEKHSFSLSGNNHFLVTDDPYAKLPKEILKPTENLSGISLNPSSNDPLFLDSFIDHRENTFTFNGPSPLNLIEDTGTRPPLNSINVQKTLTSSRPDSPWSENERDILDGASFSYDLEAQVHEESFVDNYEKEIRCNFKAIMDGLHLKNKMTSKLKNDEQSDIPLAIYIQNEKVKKMIEPDYIIHLPVCVELSYFVEQTKLLLCGISSDLFQFNKDDKKFYMKSGIYVKGLTPDSIFEVTKTFLEMGTITKTLLDALDSQDENGHGVLNTAFWGCIREELEQHCNAVCEIPGDSSLLSLTLAVNNLHHAINIFYNLIKSSAKQINEGKLLSHVYDFSVSVQKPYVQKSLLRCLSGCSTVYLNKLIEKWIFQGFWDSFNQGDFFVHINEELSDCRDRKCFLSVNVVESRVPSFLSNMAARIFACGKAVWLLKLFDPENKFNFYLESMRHPKLRICTSEIELKELECEMIEFENRIVEICGVRVSFASFQESEQIAGEEREAMLKDIHQKSAERLAKIREDLFEARRKQVEEQKKLSDEASKKFDAKKGNIRMQNLKKREGSEKMVIEDEKKKLLKEHESIMESAKFLSKRVEWRKERCKLQEKRLGVISSDWNAESTLLDEEGNVINVQQSEDDDDVNANIMNSPSLDLEKTFNNRNDLVSLRNRRKNLMSQFSLGSEGVLNQANGNMPTLIEENANFVIDAGFHENNAPLEAQKNKEKSLASGLYFNVVPQDCEKSPHPSDQEEKQETEAVSSPGLGNKVPDGMNNQMMQNQIEAMKNKMKVLGSEFCITETNCNQPYSDYFSNANGVKALTEASINKRKMMETEFGTKSPEAKKKETSRELSEAEINKIKILGTEYNMPMPEGAEVDVTTDRYKNKMKMMKTDFEDRTSEAKVDSGNVLSDAAMNKLKILGTEYNMTVQEGRELDVTTDRHKNKAKMMEGDNFNETVEQCKTRQTTNLTEAQKNKLKMLATEFDIAIPSYKKVDTSPRRSSSPRPVEWMEEEIVRVDEVFEEEISQPVEVSPSLFRLEPVNHCQDVLSDLAINHCRLDVDHLDVTSFTKYIQRSLNVVLNVQERLVNSEILKHLLFKEHMMTHMRSLRCYFLLHDGEFARSLTYRLFQSLAQSSEPRQFFNRSTLSSILHEAITCSGLSQQSFPQNLSFQIVKMPHLLNVESHDLLTPFQLSYKVNWPVNIIITDASLERYRKVFHVIVNLKRVHWTLNETFLLLKSHSKDSGLDGKLLMNSPEYTKLATYRHAMTLFIMTLEEHVCGNGLQQAWNTFTKELLNVHDLDHLYDKHVAFVKDIYRRCFLVKASRDLLSYVNELIELGLRFHYLLKSSNWHLINEKHYSHPHYSTLKSIFYNFCKTTSIFTKTLRKKTSHQEMSIHQPLIELIDVKIKV